MYTGLLHTHRLVVILFVLLYLIKLIMLLNNSLVYEKFAQKVKVPEMIISTLFLLTGIGMLTQIGEITTLIWIKMAVVFGSIPVAVIGFKQKNKVLAILSVVMILGSYGLAEVNKKQKSAKKEVTSQALTDKADPSYNAVEHGKTVFLTYCQACHGADGKLGLSGAKDLTLTAKTDAEIREVLQNGKNAMPSYKNTLSEDEIGAVSQFIQSLKK